jgi:hypothetical protein
LKSIKIRRVKYKYVNKMYVWRVWRVWRVFLQVAGEIKKNKKKKIILYLGEYKINPPYPPYLPYLQN